MSNRFHNKFHRHNHHTRPTDREGLYPDSAYDPIASPESPFQGDFYLSGNFVALSSVFVKGTLDVAIAEIGDLTVKNNLAVLGSTTTIDSYLFCLSSVEIVATGFNPALKVIQKGNSPIAQFIDEDGNRPIVFDTTGQVGIGITTPTALLHVVETGQVKDSTISVDSAFTNSKISLQTLAQRVGEILFKTPYTTHAKIASNPALSSLTFSTNNAERINIASDGKVDIFGSTKIIANDGTTDVGALTIVKPSSAFITSDIFVNTYANRVIGYDPYQGNIGGGLRIRTAGGTYDTPTSTLSGRIGYVVAASTHDGITWKNSSIINLGIESNATIDNHNSYIAFETLSGGFTSSRTEKVRITSKGRVGIGTKDPTGLSSPLSAEGHSLHVYNNTNDGTSTNSNTVVVAESVNRSAYFLASVGNSGGLSVKKSLDGTTLGRVIIDQNKDTFFQVGAIEGGLNETMRILSGGNVGIGLPDPISKLHVAGLITLNQYQGIKSVDNTTNLFIAGGSNWDKGGCINLFGPNSITVGGDPGSIAFGTGIGAANAERMRITSGGNVGIGTTTPTSTGGRNLHIYNNLPFSDGALANSTVTIESVNRNAYLYINASSSGQGGVQVFNSSTSTQFGGMLIQNDGVVRFTTGANVTETLRINSSGNVGIGTTTPSERLTVVGNTSAVGNVNITGNIAEIFSFNADSILRTKSSFGNAVIQLDNAESSTGSGPLINFQANGRSFSRIRGNIALSALSIETENVERIRFSKNGTNLYGNLTIQGDLSSTGNQYFANTYFTTTSAISVVNVSPVADIPAFYIAQSGPGDIASFYDLDQGVEVLHVGGANGNFPNVGIKNSAPNKDLTVNGEISATSTIWDPAGNSILWNSVYNWVRATSAIWQGTGPLVANTVTLSVARSITLPQSSTDIELVRSSTVIQEMTAITGGVKGITYTLTNKTPLPVTIYSSPSIIIRRGNAWVSNTTTLSGSFLVLPLSGSCSVRADTNFVSLW